ncbi:MAG: hypothetical protein HZB99_02825 [Candidatus Harrisonbacteria bacterium]|nr:hypothetical protein [Candidatus Harrisonbacteria bacterium]
MGKAITTGQSLNLFSVLANNADWDNLDSDTIQKIINDPRQAGQQFTAFLKNGGKVLVGEPKILKIDRAKPFDPVAFIGKGWSVVGEDTDARSEALTEVDLSKVRFETMLNPNETSITGEEKLKRLKKAGHIRLDAKVFQTLWENQLLIPESWKEKVNGNIRFIFFDGTVLRYPDGDRYVLCLYWFDGRWHWSCNWLGSDWDVDGPSAVLAS